MGETVKDVFEQIEKDIQHLKVQGLQTVVLCRILEGMLSIIKTIALHTTVAKVKDENPK